MGWQRRDDCGEFNGGMGCEEIGRGVGVGRFEPSLTEAAVTSNVAFPNKPDFAKLFCWPLSFTPLERTLRISFQIEG